MALAGGRLIPEVTRIVLHTFAALLLGALVGLERQVAEGERPDEKDFPGVRTFAFTALVGALSVLLAAQLGPWIAVALFAASVAFLVLRYRHQVASREDVGYTTEIASICTFAVGVLAQAEQLQVATVVTVAMVALLRSKRTLHRAADLLSPADMEILIRFLVITLIVFPLLPREPLAIFDGVLLPRDVWRMVVLISGISFAGYALMRFRVGTSGHVLIGLLAGLVSSTAATLAYAREARSRSETQPFEALIALAASATYARVAIMLLVVNPALLPRVAPALGAMALVGLTLVALRHRPEGARAETPAVENPLTLRVALTFAAIYATVLVLIHLAEQRLDHGAIYLLAALGAVPGADAPSLSLARLAVDARISADTAAIGVVVVVVSTTLAKLGLLAAVAPGPIVLRVGPSLVAMAATGAGCLWLMR